jgi:hypothetical protein
MELLRETIRKIILQESGMKTAEQLPPDTVIVIDDQNGFVEVYYGQKGNPRRRSKNPSGGIEALLYSRTIHSGKCGNALMISHAKTDGGWGPLLYDVAMEHATENYGGLVSDRSFVSDDAYDVWDFYAHGRDDVQVHQLDDLENTLTPTDEDNCYHDDVASNLDGTGIQFGDPLTKRYTKASTTIEELGNRVVFL